MVEAAVVLPIALLGLFVLLDLGMVVAQLNSLSDCARHASRIAVVRGQGASEPLGPATWSGTLADAHHVTDAVRERLLAMPPDGVSMSISWPDGDNQPGHRVEVTLHFEHPPILTAWMGTLDLSASSTMRILH